MAEAWVMSLLPFFAGVIVGIYLGKRRWSKNIQEDCEEQIEQCGPELERAAETGRRFWAKEGIFALREGRKKDSEKAYKMELRRSRQVRVFTEKAMEVKI